MIKFKDFYMLSKWENLQNWHSIKYFFSPLYIGKSPTCLLANFSKPAFLCNGFFWPLFHEAQLYGVYSLLWSYGQILQGFTVQLCNPFRVTFSPLCCLFD
ncbi:hypothetical protein XENORESO_004074 [Xenotaenia resolanae]|uniref:Uncharacterized protein n=1 Tax=Xenotaenia resolanae TaxID=208358 RepID=A0ABV0WQZ6_9TELE